MFTLSTWLKQCLIMIEFLGDELAHQVSHSLRACPYHHKQAGNGIDTS